MHVLLHFANAGHPDMHAAIAVLRGGGIPDDATIITLHSIACKASYHAPDGVFSQPDTAQGQHRLPCRECRVVAEQVEGVFFAHGFGSKKLSMPRHGWNGSTLASRNTKP